jgi:hypothetical protein
MNYKNSGILPNNIKIATHAVSKTEIVAVSAFLLYFAAKAFYFAFSIGENIFPDEVSWFGIAEIFSRSLLPPADSSDSYQFGIITRVPTLYFYLMGKALNLNIFPVSNLVFLRTFNVCISILTIWYGWKLIRLLAVEAAVRLLFIALITNTMMFTFVSASVSYDNLTNCFAVLALYYLFSFFQFRLPFNFLLFVLFACMGMLTKITFLPFAFTLLIVLLVHERKNFIFLRSAAVSFLSPFRWKNYLLLILCFFFVASNVNLYLGNIVKYGKLRPGIDKVIGLEQAMQYRLFARGYIVRLFRDGKITYLEAQNMSYNYIKHPGDRGDALAMLGKTAQEKASKKITRIDRVRYTFAWTDLMMTRTFGITGHRVMNKSRSGMLLYFTLLLIVLILLFRRIKASDLQGTGIYLLFIAGFYILLLMQHVNYNNYLNYGAIGLALQGRYTFPVIAPIYALAAFYLAGFGPTWWKWGIFLAVTGIFVYGEFPWFLQNVSPDWFFK